MSRVRAKADGVRHRRGWIKILRQAALRKTLTLVALRLLPPRETALQEESDHESWKIYEQRNMKIEVIEVRTKISSPIRIPFLLKIILRRGSKSYFENLLFHIFFVS